MSPLAWWRRRRSWPRPVRGPYPEGYAVAGETWPEFIPSEPTSESEIPRVRLIATLGSSVAAFGRSVEQVGYAARHLAEMARGRVVSPEEYERMRNAQSSGLAVSNPRMLCDIRSLRGP